jgi:WD40 repeat protein/class 3 adenylate cyclase
VRAFLIADVRGYTAFTRERGDVEAARLATGFAQFAGDAVAARNGRVVEVRGDEVLAVFASPGQATRAAIELQATLAEETARDPSLPIPAGIGIDVGDAVAVSNGFRGAALNTAARLCSQAEAGQVLVSAAAMEQAGVLDLAVFQSRGEIVVKGFTDPIPVYEAVSAIARLETPARSRPATDPPGALIADVAMAGREHELAWLRGVWRSARRGRGRLIFVSGRSGIGKTRLAAELAKGVAGQGYLVRYAGAGGTARAGLREVLRHAAGASSPLLAVLDDADVDGDATAEALAEALPAIEAAPVLVVAVVADADAVPGLAALVEQVNREGDGHRLLPPLAAAEIAEVARGYAGDDTEEVPIESIMRASGGVPAAAHELLDAWARDESARRLSAAAEWLAAGRRQRADDLEFAGNAIELRLRRIYVTPEASPATSACPYRGLEAFREADAGWFFGRERLVGDLAARTVGAGLLAVAGPSGSGKSSLISAGLLPSLAAGILPGSATWQTLTVRPGRHPLRSLPQDAIAAANADRRLVLAVDQFEEVFTLCDDMAERTGFLDALVAAAANPDRAVVVLGIRGDYLDGVSEHPALAELVAANAVLVPAMTRAECRRAIELPARRCGVRVESALAELLAAEVADQPGALPLLSTALVELWGARDDGWLRGSAYEQTGGIRGAVGRLAERSYQEMSDAERRTARRVFLRLAGSGEADGLTRRRVELAEFDVDQDATAGVVIDRLVRDRLLTRDGDTVEVAHEALLREWPRFREWLVEEGQGRAVRRHLTESAVVWRDNGRPAGDLYRAERLSAAASWSSTHAGDMNQLEREFLTASQHQSARSVRRLQLGVGVLAVLLAAALAAGVVALAQRGSARRAARAADQQEQVANGQRVGLEALREPDLSRSLLLAVAGYRIDPSPQTRSDLAAALTRARSAIAVFHFSERPLAEAVSPDGRTLAVAGDISHVVFFDTRSGRQIGARIANKDMDPPGVAFSPDGRTLAIFADSHGRPVLKLVDVRSHRVIATVQEPSSGSINSVAFSPDGRMLAGVITPTTGLGSLVEWRLPGLRRLPQERPVPGATFISSTPAGRIVAIAGSKVATYAPQRLRLLRRYRGGKGSAAVSSDGRSVAFVTPRAVSLLDLTTGALRRDRSMPPGGPVHDPVFTADGRSLVGTDRGRDMVSALDLTTGRLTMLGREHELISVIAARTGVYTTSLDRTAVRWGLHGGRFGSSFDYAPSGRGNVMLGVGAGGVAVTAAFGGPLPSSLAPARVWDLSTGQPLGAPISPGPAGVGWAAVSADGRRIAVTNQQSGRVVLWDTRSRRVVGHLDPPVHHDSPTLWVTFSPDGSRIATATEDQISPLVVTRGYITVWDTRTGAVVDTFRQPGNNGISTVQFSPDGRRLVSVGEGGSVAVWDLIGHRLIASWRTSDDYSIEGIFPPDGRSIATGGYGGGNVSFWNAENGKPRHFALHSSGHVYPSGYFDGGRSLAVAADAPGRVELWDVAHLQRLASFPVGGGLPGAAITPDGRTLVVTSTRGILSTWPLSTARWVADACAIANRDLTAQEWQTYVGTSPAATACTG